MSDATCSDDSSQPCDKQIIDTLSDDEPAAGQDAESQPPAVAVADHKRLDPGKVRARVSFLVGTSCICSRARKQRNGQLNLSCHRQFRGDVDRLTGLRLKLHRLSLQDMNDEVWSLSKSIFLIKFFPISKLVNSDSIVSSSFGLDRWSAY